MITIRSQVQKRMAEVVGKTVENKQVIFKGYIDGVPKVTDMELKFGNMMKLEAQKGSGAVLVKNLYLSCDSYMRGRMRNYQGSYIPPFVPGKVIEGFGVCKVVDSDEPNFKPGELVSGFTGWEEYSLIYKHEQLTKIQPDDVPLSYYIGLLGVPGLTAYAGLYEVCAPKQGEHVFVSAASAAVGQVVGQLAKLKGCYVVGSAGSSQKVGILKNKLGFDEAFNYKEEPDLDAALKRYFPEGIDIYFDNIGGPMLDAAIVNMRNHGRIAACGVVSQQGISGDRLFTLIAKRIKMQGFMQSDYQHLLPRFLEELIGYYKQGKLSYIENMYEGLENGPPAFVGLFSGDNIGKQVIHVATE